MPGTTSCPSPRSGPPANPAGWIALIAGPAGRERGCTLSFPPLPGDLTQFAFKGTPLRR